MLQRLKNREGEWKETPEEIQGIVQDYLSQLFQSTSPDGDLTNGEVVQQVTDMVNEDLVKEIMEEEVKDATFSMHPDKSPGLDGLNPAFFQSFWHIVKHDVVSFCQQFMNTGRLPLETNKAVVCLIPKVKMPQTMADLRPISLYNVLARIL